MNKRTILVIGPVSPQASDVESIALTLKFLEKDYRIDYVDSLMITDPVSNDAYYNKLWQAQFRERMSHYHGFLGFSFGGIILQQCFSIFESMNKPIVLFSTPAFADTALTYKLGKVISLCKANMIDKALHCLYQDVFLKQETQAQSFAHLDQDVAAKRLIFGLTRVLNTDSTDILTKTQVDHLHLIGENSRLVNRENVITPNTGCLSIVPNAGMRVLQDNPAFCQHLILERLSRVV